MKYIKKYESFKNQNSEPVNEEFLSKLIGGMKELFKKAKDRINKTKGGKEIEAIYQKYILKIHDELKKTTKIDLNIAAAATGVPAAAATASTPAAGAPATPGATASAPTKESFSYSKSERIFEDADDTKLAVDSLKAKKAIMDQIVQKLKAIALREMDAVLTKFGGATANPQLNIILQTKKDQFDMDYLNAQIAYLDAAGDKTMIADITKRRDIVAKKIEAEMKDFDAAKVIKYEVGEEVIYLLKDKTPDMYDKKKKPEDQKAIVGIHKIAEIDGDNFILEDEKGEPTIKKLGKDIMGKVGGAEATEEYKVGDFVIHLKQDKKKEEWDALTDEEKKDPKGEKAKVIVGIHKIEKIEGDNFTFKDSSGVDFTKTKDQILGKSEAAPVDGQEELQKKLVDMKAQKPDDIKKVSSYVDFISKPENAAKVAEIEKIVGGGEVQQ